MIAPLASVLYLALCAYAAHGITVTILRASPPDDLRQFITGVLVFFALFFGIFFILGLLSQITYLALVRQDAALGIAVIIGVLVWYRKRRGASASYAPSLGKTLYSLLRQDRAAGTVTLLTLATFLAYGLMLMAGFPRGFEVRAYHLPNALHILQTQTLAPWDAMFPHTLPLNASLYYAFFLQFLPERFAAASNLVFLAILAPALYATSRRAGGSQGTSLLAATGTMTIPIVAFSALEPSADIGGIAFLAIAVYLACCREIAQPRRAALVGAACGLAYGFKTFHLIGSVVLVLVLLLESRHHAGSLLDKVKAAIRILSGFSLGWLAMAGFWLLRNWLDFHNPLYPVSFSFLETWLGWARAPDIDFSARAWTQFDWVRTPAEWLVYPWIEWNSVGQNFKPSSGLGAFFAAAIPVSLCAAIAVLLLRPPAIPRTNIPILITGTIAITAAWWILNDRQPRYAMGMLPFASPLTGWTLAAAQGVSRRVFHGVTIVAIVVMVFLIGASELFRFGDRILYSHGYERSRFYEYPEQVDRLAPGATILNLGERTWHYPLAGSHLQNRVISLAEALRLLTGKPADNPPERVRLACAALQSKGVTHVFTDKARLDTDGCVSLTEVARLDRNLNNGVRLPSPRILYVVQYAVQYERD